MIDRLVNTPINSVTREVFEESLSSLVEGRHTEFIIGPKNPYDKGDGLFVGWRSGARGKNPLYTGVYVKVLWSLGDVVAVELDPVHRVETDGEYV